MRTTLGLAVSLLLGSASAFAMGKGEVSSKTAFGKGAIAARSAAKVRAPASTVLYRLPFLKNAIQQPIPGVVSRSGKTVLYTLKRGQYGTTAGDAFRVVPLSERRPF